MKDHAKIDSAQKGCIIPFSGAVLRYGGKEG